MPTLVWYGIFLAAFLLVGLLVMVAVEMWKARKRDEEQP